MGEWEGGLTTIQKPAASTTIPESNASCWCSVLEDCDQDSDVWIPLRGPVAPECVD